MGYLPLAGEAAVLFQVITQRYCKGSIALTTNLGVGSWGRIFDDPMVVAAMLDRLAPPAPKDAELGNLNDRNREFPRSAAGEADGPDQAQVEDLAAACGSFERRYECFVLVQGVCGLRPGEARDVRRRDFDFSSVPALVTVRGSHSDVPGRFFAPGETRRRPLKARGGKARRSIPIPSDLVPRFGKHLDGCVSRQAEALVFTTPGGRRIHLSNFHRDVWVPARERVFRRTAHYAPDLRLPPSLPG